MSRREVLKDFLVGLPVAVAITGGAILLATNPWIFRWLLLALLIGAGGVATWGMGYSIRRDLAERKQAKAEPQP